MEDSKEELDEWRDLVMSSKGSIFSGFAPENCENRLMDEIFVSGEASFGCNDLEKEGEDLSKFDLERTMSEGCDNGSNSSIVVDNVGEVKSGRSSIAERRAIKCGFNASKIGTSRFRSSNMLPSPSGTCSPYVTISSGISPQTLLDSPMLLPNSQLSPTTGTFASHPLDGGSQMLMSASHTNADKGSDGSAMFKLHTETTSVACFHDADNQFCKDVGMDNQDAGSPPDRKISSDLTVSSNSATYQLCDSNNVAYLPMPHENGPSMVGDSGTPDSLDADHNGIYTHTGTVRTAEDGYNWRKYGQKQVKGSEYPRSYYKCTHPNCPVKKKVERSHDGQITEIIYKGAHSHPKPQPCRKSTLGSSLSFNDTSDLGDVSGSCMKANSCSVWRNMQLGYKDVIGSDWRIDGLERTSSTATEVSDPLSATQGKPIGVLESAGTPEFSSTVASNEDDEEDAATQGSFLIGHDNENEPDLKRRKKEGSFAETTLSSRAVREPRVVVQIESDIDILDDGYRWRKYGQKVVKGNPNPRSYYKCTTTGCTVRKHVERSSQSMKFVITTYEGKHNHEVPAARNSGHANSGSGNLSAAATSTKTAPTLPRNSHLLKPEPHAQDHPLHFEARTECINDFFRPNFFGNLGAGTPFYAMKFPALPNTPLYGPFDLSTHHLAYASSIVPAIPDLSFSLPLRFPLSYCNPERSHSSVQPLLAGQQFKETDVKLLKPKQERRDDSFFDTDMHSIDHTDNSSSVYNHVMGTFRS